MKVDINAAALKTYNHSIQIPLIYGRICKEDTPMEFDLTELLQYLGLHGYQAIIFILFLLLVGVCFSSKKPFECVRARLINIFSSTSASLHREQERLAEKVSNDIDEVLENLQSETGANNVLVIRFRNGDYDSIGSSVLKFFASNEKTKAGYMQIGQNIQNISRTLHGKFCDTLIREHKVYIKDKTAITDNAAEIASLMQLFGNAERFYARSLITTHEQGIIGFVCLVYTEPHRIAESRIDEALRDACARITAKIEMGKLTNKQQKKS